MWRFAHRTSHIILIHASRIAHIAYNGFAHRASHVISIHASHIARITCSSRIARVVSHHTRIHRTINLDLVWIWFGFSFELHLVLHRCWLHGFCKSYLWGALPMLKFARHIHMLYIYTFAHHWIQASHMHICTSPMFRHHMCVFIHAYRISIIAHQYFFIYTRINIYRTLLYIHFISYVHFIHTSIFHIWRVRYEHVIHLWRVKREQARSFNSHTLIIHSRTRYLHIIYSHFNIHLQAQQYSFIRTSLLVCAHIIYTHIFVLHCWYAHQCSVIHTPMFIFLICTHVISFVDASFSCIIHFFASTFIWHSIIYLHIIYTL